MKIDLFSRFHLCVYVIISILSVLETTNGVSLRSYEYANLTRVRRQAQRCIDDDGTCELPEHPEFGQWSILECTTGYPKKKVHRDTLLQYGCNEGYKLSAEDPYVVCTAKDWSVKEMPTCLKKCPPLYTNGINIKCLNNRNLEIKCDDATDGTSATFTCAPYYEWPDRNINSKKITRYCQSGSWDLPPPVCQPVCGEEKLTAVPLIVGGIAVGKGDYPWVTAIYDVTREYWNICGGSILTQRVILTAAHCVSHQWGSAVDKESRVVGVGKHYNKYKHPRDTQAQYSKIDKIIIPSTYKGRIQRYESDIALLITKDVLLLSKAVQPVCFQDLPDIHLESGFTGVITGWGNTEMFGSPADELQKISVSFKPYSICTQELPSEWAQKFLSYDKICAGYEGKAVCQGDTGGGLIFKNPKDERYYVHGIASLGIGCTVEHSTLYTNVATHYQWLEKLISQYLIVGPCELPEHPDFGQWSLSGGVTGNPQKKVPADTVLIFNCNQGYNLSSENADVICQTDGWSVRKMPTCLRVNETELGIPTPKPPIDSEPCELPDHPKFGQWSIVGGAEGFPNQKVHADTAILFGCNEGYKLSSETAYVVCKTDGWSLEMPTCLKKCPPLYTTEVTNIECRSNRNVKIKCDEATHGTSATFTCAPYYESRYNIKSKKVYCWSGTWTLPLPVCQPVCGEKKVTAVPLIVNGTVIEKGDYPWVTAIYIVIRNFQYICGGSILTQRVILTAAHCVTDQKGNVFEKDIIEVGVGKYYSKYKDPRDTQAQYSKINQVIVPRAYKGEDQRFQSDIALLVTKDVLLLSKVVQPVCYQNLQNLYLEPSFAGVITGWGYTESFGNVSDALREISVLYKPEDVCKQEFPDDWAQKYYTHDKMCAGRYNESKAVCKGDSGGGLVFKNPKDQRYYVHGIASITHAEKGGCNIQVSTLYTKVAVHYDWLEKLISRYLRV